MASTALAISAPLSLKARETSTTPFVRQRCRCCRDLFSKKKSIEARVRFYSRACIEQFPLFARYY